MWTTVVLRLLLGAVFLYPLWMFFNRNHSKASKCLDHNPRYNVPCSINLSDFECFLFSADAH